MVNLLIDGKQVNLSSDVSFEHNSANPFFTKDGEYTYDIDIDLNDPQNSIVYKSIDRLDITSRPTKRSALLYDEYGIIINGTEIILEIDIHVAKIQLVSGNSDLNYLSAGDTSIRSYDLGTINISSVAEEQNNLNASYPARNYVCTPVMRKIDSSNTDYKNKMNISESGPVYDNTVTVQNMQPQPFLLYYIEKIVLALGYQIKSNCLREEEKWCHLILVNGIDTREYAKMLPDWKASEFFTEVEKLFNVLFLVDQNAKTVDIVSIPSFYASRSTYYIKASDIIDETDKKFDQDESLYLNYKNVRYDFPDYDYYKYADIDPDIEKLCLVSHIDSWMVDVNLAKSNFNKLILFNLIPVDTYLIQTVLSVSDNNGNITTPAQYSEVKNFQRVINDTESDDFVEFKIIPSEMRGVVLTHDENYTGTASMPVTRNSYELNETNAVEGLNEYIKNGIPEESSPDRIFIAFYDGLLGFTSEYEEDQEGNVTFTRTNSLYPQCHTRQAEMSSPFSPYANCLFNPERTLQLDGSLGMYQQYYSEHITVDTTKEYVIKFRSFKRPSPMNIFNIANKKFYCKNLKYTVKNGSMSEIVEGTFYLMN